MDPPPPPDPSLHPPPHVPPDSIHTQSLLPDPTKTQEEPEGNLNQSQDPQRSKELQQTREHLAQITIKEGKEAERKEQENIADQGNLKKKEDLSVGFARGHQPSDEEVDLSAIMRTLQIAIPEDIEVGYQEEQLQKPEENSPCRLLMKVASSSGTPRNIPLQALNDAMARAWGENYWIIDQVKSAMYVAYFSDDDALDFVLKRQPWSLDGDNLLLEWINPREADKSVDDYQFRYIYVPIRVYGVPERFRTPDLMRYVINKVAQPSDLHPPPDILMTVRKDYIQAYAKMDITNPVKDKVKYYVSPNEYILFYLNYDKVKRICIFCGVMFHSVQHCPSRRKLIMHLQSIKASTNSVPFSYIGIWTSQASKIPSIAFEQSNILGGLPLERRRDRKTDMSSDTDQCSLSRFKILKEGTSQTRESMREGDKYMCANVHAGSLLALELPPKTGTIQIDSPRGRATWTPQSLQENVEVHNLSTHAIIKNQQLSHTSVPQQRLKRQAEAEAITFEEFKRGHGYTRLRSAPPASPQYSGTASSLPIASEMHGVYRPPHLRYGQDTESAITSQQAHQHLLQQKLTYKFSQGASHSPSADRRKVRPKRRNRWDEKRVETGENTFFHSGHYAGVPQNYIEGAVQQAQQIAAKHVTTNMQANTTSASMPAQVQGIQDPEQYKLWLHNVAASTFGPASEGDQHWGLQPTGLVVDDTGQVYVCDKEDPEGNAGTSNIEGIDDNSQNIEQAEAPAFKAPRAQ